MPNIETHVCTFSDGSSVVVKVDFDAAASSKEGVPRISPVWSRNPDRKVVPEYVRWMHTVMADVAKRVNKNMFYLYPCSDMRYVLVYVYKADGTYEKVERRKK